MRILQLLEQVIGEQAMTLFLEALSGLITVGSGHNDQIAHDRPGILSLHFHGPVDTEALIVTSHTAETSVKEDRNPIKAQSAQDGVEVIKSDAELRFCTIYIGGQQVSAVVIVDVGDTMAGIVNQQLFELAVADLIPQPIGQFLLQNHVLGGVFTQMHVLGRYSKRLLAILQVLLMFLGKRVILFTLGVIASVIIYCKTIGKGWLMAVIALLWFMAVILLNGTDRIYLNVLSLFTVLAAGIVTQALSRWLRWWAAVGVLSVGVLALLFGTVEHKSLFAKQLLDREIWYYYPTLLSQYEQPRLLYLMCHDHGEGVPVDALPACKYWSLQMGYTQAMIRFHASACSPPHRASSHRNGHAHASPAATAAR